MKIFAFLSEFAELSPVQQKIFLFCLKNLPHPRKYTSDIARIAAATGYHRKSIEKALKVYATKKILHRLVSYIHLDVKQEFYAESAADLVERD